jgi:hypothetical protein
MAQHGYLHDTYDRDDFGRGDDRDRDRERDWRSGGEHREHSWRGEDRDWRGEGRDWRDRHSDWNERDRDRGFMFRDEDDRHPLGATSDRGSSTYRREGAFGGSSDYAQGRRSYSAHPDDHYRSWRDRQVQMLDQDYADYCREREQQFHREFDDWRRNRQSSGMQSQSQQSGSSEQVMELDNPAAKSGEIPGATTSPTGAATLGTNNSENSATTSSATGRGRR